MNTRIVVLTCALTAGACGAPDARPANDPAMVNTTAASSDTSYSTTAQTTDPMGSVPNTAPAAMPPSVQRAPLEDKTARTGSFVPTNANKPMPATATAVAPAPAGANVVADPGSADQTKNADNTKINDRDRHGALTPMDQGGSATERNITASIRRGVVGDKSLSFTAKNVKIITTGGKVTLRGPVNSEQERSAIEARAKQTAGVTEVDNQLEVKK